MILFLWLAGCSSYPPSDAALDALESRDGVTVEEGRFLTFTPDDPSPGAVVFYPGGLVAPEAYAPPMRAVAEAGHLSVIVPMPSDLAVLAPGKAAKVFDAFEDEDTWVIAGHSLGGAMAAQFAANHPDDVVGLALWAAYPPKGADLSDAGVPVVSVTATEDGVLDLETYEAAQARLPDDTVHVEIVGGNHAGFGSYGPQDGDGDATLPAAEQQALALEPLLELLDAD